VQFRTVSQLDQASLDALIVAVDRDGNALGGPPDSERELAELVARESGPAVTYTPRSHLRPQAEGAATGSAGAGAVARLIVVAAGRREEYDRERARNIVSAGVKALWHTTAKRIAIVLDDENLGLAAAVRAAVEGVQYAMWRPEAHRTGEDERRLPPLDEVQLLVSAGDEAAAEAAIERGLAVGEAVNWARRLANEPANLLTPTLLAEEARQLAERAGLEFEALDADACRALGMGSFLSVARGSIEPPRFIVLRYRGGGAGEGYDLALVGKGITFDSGGISIKPAEDMHLMKYDMTGAASVIAAMGAIAGMGLPLNVLAVAPCTENLPGGSATKPGDVVTSMSGKTVEVINTDAEGRLVLIDALTYAQREGARRLVDVATLTGGIKVALGSHFTGLFGRPRAFVDSVLDAGAAAGERMWPMPLSDEYRDEMKSDIADIKNSSTRWGSPSKGAAFIDAAIEPDAEWAHLDIAGSAWFEEDRPFSPKGPQGVPVRTLVALAEALSG
jgi:leucyl aminopeptidase